MVSASVGLWFCIGSVIKNLIYIHQFIRVFCRLLSLELDALVYPSFDDFADYLTFWRFNSI